MLLIEAGARCATPLSFFGYDVDYTTPTPPAENHTVSSAVIIDLCTPPAEAQTFLSGDSLVIDLTHDDKVVYDMTCV
jgi:hypothetical protein